MSTMSSSLFPNVSTTSVPDKDIVLDACQVILYGTVNPSSIRIFDVVLLIPNAFFLIFLVYRLGFAHIQLHKIKCPIVKTVYSMVVLVCVVGIIRCFVSMLLSSIQKHPHRDALPTKILWLLLSCFLLAVELSVIIFGVWAGNMQDGRKGVQRVLCVTSICAIAYSSAQAALEFVRCPGLKGIYGKHKYDLFGHGGLLFWSSTSLFFAMVYFVIVILPCTKLRECCIIPARKTFYGYCGFLCLINVVQGCAIVLLYTGFSDSLCALDWTMFVYYTLFGPLVYRAFLKDFFGRTNFHVFTVGETNYVRQHMHTNDNESSDEYA